jgi:hypothetical protein
MNFAREFRRPGADHTFGVKPSLGRLNSTREAGA